METKNNTNPKAGAIYERFIEKINKIIKKVEKQFPPMFISYGNVFANETEKDFKAWVKEASKYKNPKSSKDIVNMYKAALELYDMQYADTNGPLQNYYNACRWITTLDFLDMLEYLINEKNCTVTFENYGQGKSASSDDNEESNLIYDRALLDSIKSNFDQQFKECDSNWYKFGNYDNQLEPSLKSDYIKDKIKALSDKEISKKADKALK